jgi:glucose/mannose transport system substrate-binding protein
VDQLTLQLAAHGVVWKDAAVAGGGGISATKVLNTRILMGDAPDVSPAFRQWASLGLARSLDAVAKRQHWRQLLFPEVMEQISDKGHVIAAPLGIHRINSMLYNRPLFARLGLEPPRTWA